MGKKEQVPARAILMQGSLWVWSATSRGRPPDGGLALAVFHMVPRVPATLNLFVHPPAEGGHTHGISFPLAFIHDTSREGRREEAAEHIALDIAPLLALAHKRTGAREKRL